MDWEGFWIVTAIYLLASLGYLALGVIIWVLPVALWVRLTCEIMIGLAFIFGYILSIIRVYQES